MTEIIISVVISGILFGAGGFFVGKGLAEKNITQNYEIKQETIQQVKNQTIAYTIQGQFTIVDTKTNISFSLNEFTNLVRTLIITNIYTTNYTNFLKE